MSIKPLKESVFNYKEYAVYRFIHYFQQIHHVFILRPKKVLEIGPGDHCVTDFLIRKGINVKTFDNDENLFPDYFGDVRETLRVDDKFDVVLASKILEHLDISWLDKILENIKEVMTSRGYLIVSLPYSTIRLWPEKCKWSNFFSYNGRLFTYIPFYYVQPILTLLRSLKRIFLRQGNLKQALEYYVIPKYPDDRLDVHRWDLGCYPTTRRRVRKIFSRHFKIVQEKIYINTNCVFYILKKEI